MAETLSAYSYDSRQYFGAQTHPVSIAALQGVPRNSRVYLAKRLRTFADALENPSTHPLKLAPNEASGNGACGMRAPFTSPAQVTEEIARLRAAATQIEAINTDPV